MLEKTECETLQAAVRQGHILTHENAVKQGHDSIVTRLTQAV
ncbi:hypothetical protein [Neisseria chenwenguii]|nr:hypothetical protein [Neisseria chenwenguii]